MNPTSLAAKPLPQKQELTIIGLGFTPTSKLTFFDGTTSYSKIVPTYVSKTELKYDIAVGPDAASWSVKVVNDTIESKTFLFIVNSIIDTVAPNPPIDLFTSPLSWTNKDFFYLDWVNPGDPSGIVKVWLKFGSAPTSSIDGLAFDLPLFKPLPFSILTEGTETIYIWLEDGAGNKDYNKRSSVSVHSDISMPEITITNPTSNVNFITDINYITLSGSFFDNLSGVMAITWSNNNGDTGSALVGEYWYTQVINLIQGENIITVVAVDAAGNIGVDSITVTFTPNDTSRYSLNVSATNGIVSKNPDQESYTTGSQVSLTAMPNTGYKFSSWSGACTGTGTCNVTITSNLSIIANFTEIIPPPAAPTGTSASDGAYTDRVRVTWNGVDSATGYEVWRSLEANAALATLIAQTTLLSYDDMSAPAATQFWYYVRAYITESSFGDFGDPNRGYRDSPPPNDTWVVYPIDKGDNGADGTGFFSEIMVDSNNHTHIVYLMWNGKIWHATDETGAWTREIIGTSGDINYLSPLSLAIDSSDNLHISYRDNTTKDLVYVTNASGNWQQTSIDTVEDVGAYSSIAVDATGYLHISYQDETNHNLKYATNKSGSWVSITVDDDGWIGYGTSIALDKGDSVHISYATSSDEMELRYVTNSSGSWNIFVVDINVNGGSSNALTSIAVDSNNKAHIFYKNIDGNLLYATNESDSWSTTTVDDSGFVRKKTSTVIDVNGYLHVAYIVGSKLAYATNLSGPLSTFHLIGGIDNQDPAIATDLNGRLHISFCETHGDGDLIYTTNATIPTSLHRLTVVGIGTGSGTVTSDPAGIYCGTDCDEQFLIGEGPIALTVADDEGSTFTGWGGACTGVGDCSVMIDAIREVTATFIQNTNVYTLSVNTNGNGMISSTPTGINCGDDCSESFGDGTSVDLSVIAAPGWFISDMIFESPVSPSIPFDCEKLWIQNSLGSNPTDTYVFFCTITMDRDWSVTAVFDIDTDGDGVPDSSDICIGDDLFGDIDLDGYCDDIDNCQIDYNPDQADATDPPNDIGNICDDGDADGDGISDMEETSCGSDPADLHSTCNKGLLPWLMILLDGV